MPNLFFRTSIAPYRIDTYNALHTQLGAELYFYYDYDSSQNLNEEGMRQACVFTPHYLKAFQFGESQSRTLCTHIWHTLRVNKPEIVIVPEFQPIAVQVLLYKTLFRKKFKVVSMCDDSYDMVGNDRDFSRFHKLMRRLIAPWVDELLLVDSRVRDWYRQHYHKGLWLPIIRDEKKERPLYEAALPISRDYIDRFGLEGKKILLYVGRLVDEKNLDTLIEAISRTKEEFTTILVGSGTLESSLREKAARSKKEIIFAGHYVDEGVRAWYNVADVFILPSKQEPYGAVTNEALIAGAYSIVSERAGSACLISDENGKVINPLDPDRMAQTIDETMSKVRPATELKVKENKMPFLFDDIVEDIIVKLKQ